MAFAADYGMHYVDDGDHRIDLLDPHFRQQDAYHQILQQQAHQQRMHHPDYYPTHHSQYSHLAGISVDVKPRLTKEQHDVLETHYQSQNKPNTQTKKGFAETLGVSLDKVNNWFQNRRAKSKQDAKKAAGQTAQSQQQSQPAQLNQLPQQQDAQHVQDGSSASAAAQQPHALQTPVPVSNDDLATQFISSEFLSSPHNDSAVNMKSSPTFDGLGISQDLPDRSRLGGEPSTMAPQDMLNNSVQATPPGLTGKDLDLEANRMTLTQEQFNDLARKTEFTAKGTDSALNGSPEENQDLFPSLGEFNFGGALDVGLDSNDMQTDLKDDLFGTSLFSPPSISSDAPRRATKQGSISGWSDVSTPSLGAGSMMPHPDSGYGASDNDVSPRGKAATTTSSGQWLPGTSIPVDFEAMDRDFAQFRETGASARSQSGSSGHTSRKPSIAMRHQMSFQSLNGDPSFTQAEAPAGLTQSMNNMGLANETQLAAASGRVGGSAGGIAARRQRPRPQPLSASSLRSASYCGTSLPTAPGIPASTTFTPTAPTLRRIKSSNVMNGFANGRIQKSFAGPQRSPINFSFAEAMNSPRFARRVSSFSPANGMLGATSASLAPPTPLSPTELSQRLEQQRQGTQRLGAHHLSRQPSINELHEESHSSMMTSDGLSHPFSSPPTTPNYAAQYARGRLGHGLENTPPQSAPASQQCFPNHMYLQGQQGLGGLPSGMMTSQGQSYPTNMVGDFQASTMSMSSAQMMQPGQYLQMMGQHNFNDVSQMLPQSQPMGINYGNMAFPQGLTQQQITPPNMQFPFVPSSPGHLLNNQQHPYQIHHSASKSVPAADFTVHEYSPPQDAIKRETTPRKNASDNGPKTFTFANHGPEHFEKSKINKDLSASPDSLSGHSSSA